MEESLFLYAIRNKAGKYFKSKGFGGIGCQWVDSLESASIYSKKGSARAQITYFANRYPEFGVADLVELHVTRVVISSEEDRIKQVELNKKMKAAMRLEKESLLKLEKAQRRMAEAKAEIERLKGGV